MHLLVLSAFRLVNAIGTVESGNRSQCTFWCSVLSDRKLTLKECKIMTSQCTFWCSVLSDRETEEKFLINLTVSMHLLVLSAFRREVSFSGRSGSIWSQCTFWCSVLSDWIKANDYKVRVNVSMHLLVLSAFRLRARSRFASRTFRRLNAPFGAQCFPTYSRGLGRRRRRVSMHLLVLSAFRPVGHVFDDAFHTAVSMHLLVLSAFRREDRDGEPHRLRLNAPFGAQCFPTPSFLVLERAFAQSQCTFWCSVLSDSRAARGQLRSCS